MIALLLLGLIMLIATVWWLIRPLRKQPESVFASEHADLEQLRDRLLTQLNELDAEQADRGIDSTVAREEELRLSAELAAILKRLENFTPAASALAMPRSGTLAMTAALATLLLTISGGLYAWLNADNLHGFVLAAQNGVAKPGVPPLVFDMVAKLEKRLAEQPNDAEGWARLARSYVVLERKDKALAAYAKANNLAPDNTVVLAEYAWLVFNENPGVLTEQVQTLYNRLAKLEPAHPDALWFLGFSAYQEGNYRKAIGLWEQLLKLLPAEDPGRQHLQKAIASARDKTAR